MSDERHAIDLESWHEEKTSAWLYGVASASETDPVIKQMFLDLADAAEVQAAIVARDMNPAPASFHPPARARLVDFDLDHRRPSGDVCCDRRREAR